MKQSFRLVSVVLSCLPAFSASQAQTNAAIFAPNVDKKLLAPFESKVSPSECAAQIAMGILQSQHVYPSVVVANPYRDEQQTAVDWSAEDMKADMGDRFFYEFKYRMNPSPKSPSFLGVLEISFQNHDDYSVWGSLKKYRSTTCHLVLNRYNDFRTTHGIFVLPSGRVYKLQSDFSQHAGQSTITSTDGAVIETQIEGNYRKIIFHPNDRTRPFEVLGGRWLDAAGFYGLIDSKDLTTSSVLDAIVRSNSVSMEVSGQKLKEVVSYFDMALRKDVDSFFGSSAVVNGYSGTENIEDFFNHRLTNTFPSPE